RREEVVEHGVLLPLLVHLDHRLAQRPVEVGEELVPAILELLDARELRRPDLEHEVDEVRERDSLHGNSLLGGDLGRREHACSGKGIPTMIQYLVISPKGLENSM